MRPRRTLTGAKQREGEERPQRHRATEGSTEADRRQVLCLLCASVAHRSVFSSRSAFLATVCAPLPSRIFHSMFSPGASARMASSYSDDGLLICVRGEYFC